MIYDDFLAVAKHETDEMYHEQSKTGKFMSSHLLDTFRRSPKLYFDIISGITEQPDSAAFAFGRAAHKLLMEGDKAFSLEYSVSDGPLNMKTGLPYGRQTKMFQDWANTQSKQIVSNEEYHMLSEMKHSMNMLPDIGTVKGESGMAEAVIRAEYCGVNCQIKIDWFSESGNIIDLKTTAELRYFENDAFRFHYMNQMAFYQSVLEQAISKKVPVYIIAVEKCEPYSACIYSIPQAELDTAARVNEAALNRYKECLKSGIFPTGYEQIRFLSFK